VAPPQLNLMARLVKRSFDIVTAALGLIVMAPLLAMIVVMIKSSSAGPFIFTQQRIGRGGRPFTIYKFRTMNVNAENERESLNLSNDVGGPTFKMHVDPRTYAFGGFLRQLSLDEIPQLFNVLRGEMSLIGPRPFILSESEHLDGWASRRFDVRPGLSGLWQISGRNDLSFDELRRLDYVYVASWSFWWDLRILWHTPGSVWTRRGAY
jgi:lipopolysaccharide/colanic/teichoic acid biosynthesis glycosyltransferase